MEVDKEKCELMENQDENFNLKHYDSNEAENNTEVGEYDEIDDMESNSSEGDYQNIAELSSEKINKLQFLSFDDVKNLMETEIESVQNVINLSKQMTKQILNKFNWDKEKLFDKFFEVGEEEMIKSLNIEVPIQIEQQTVENHCQICLETDTELLKISCGHGYCEECWEQYLTVKIIDEGCADGILCPSHKCHFLLDENMIISTLRNQSVCDRYKSLLCSNYVICDRLMRFCPVPTCNTIIKTEIAKVTVQCACGHVFCFQCGFDLHEPVKCETVLKWEELIKTDGMSDKWIHENTKNCPQCKSPIQKNGGCNHMYCPSCKFDFCWACLRSTKNHYACESYSVDDSKGEKTFDNDFIHYFNLYKLMEESIRFEKAFFKPDILLSNINPEKHWMSENFIEIAVDALYKNRRVLMYSYVFACFIDLNTWKTIFEQNLEALRRSTENLSALLEREISNKSIKDLKQKIRDFSGYCENRRKILIKFVADGYQNDYWTERKSDPSSKSGISNEVYEDVNKLIESGSRRIFGPNTGRDFTRDDLVILGVFRPED